MEHMPRRSKPHIAIVTFRIDIRPLNSDNTFNDYILQNKDLEKYSLGEKAQIVVRGTCEADCAVKVKNMLEKLNEK
tara:strand:+ start:184 stop:411 length:228 start_codon:yes stop_codon:yes gene_type:complete